MCSLQVKALGAFATWTPVWPRACQTPKAAPVTSVATSIRPTSMTSIGPMTTVPPAPVIFTAVASASLEAK